MNPAIRHTNRRGFTAIELITVLVIGFFIIAMSASKMGDLFLSSKITNEISNTMELGNALRSLRGNDGYGTDGDITDSFKKSASFPSSIKIKNDKIVNSWDKKIIIHIIDSGANATITNEDIPKKAASRLATALLASSTFSKLTVNEKDLTSKNSTQEVLDACATENDTLNFVLTLTS